MLVKEYRIPLPLSVEEYRVAQLYMIAKKSREESDGEGSGVEILTNEPYEEGPGGDGQYTKKIYHVGRHLAAWLKALLPKSALTVEEEAWNAYPYTKTRYTCPFVEKFSIEIETRYFDDSGDQDNVFKLTGNDLSNRTIDLIDIVKDQLIGTDHVDSEDPSTFVSEKTSRGPLTENWIEECKNSASTIMCAYKLCRVEFKYWGMQTKIERYIHDHALRRVMLRAHRQAWAWQDEWFGLTMEDIRKLEKETQVALAKTMANANDGEGAAEQSEAASVHSGDKAIKSGSDSGDEFYDAEVK
ncbi:Protein retinal degeneration B [Halotydeus destructor]|nr:Protein retinal degeneration B [Halotydeus destructor]